MRVWYDPAALQGGSVNPSSPILVLAVAAVAALAFALGYLVGRRRNDARDRIAELEAALESAREELRAYRDRVAEHFERASDVVEAFTLRFREVYDHLATGARDLCGDRAPALAAGAPPAALPGRREEEGDEELLGEELLSDEELASEDTEAGDEFDALLRSARSGPPPAGPPDPEEPPLPDPSLAERARAALDERLAREGGAAEDAPSEAAAEGAGSGKGAH